MAYPFAKSLDGITLSWDPIDNTWISVLCRETVQAQLACDAASHVNEARDVVHTLEGEQKIGDANQQIVYAGRQ